MKIENTEQIEEAIEDLEKRIIEAQIQSTKIKTIPKKSPLPLDVKILLEEKKKAKKRYRRTFDPADKTILNKLTNEVKERVRQVFNDDWDTKLEELNTEDQSLWRMTSALTGRKTKAKIPNLKKENRVAVTNEEKAEMFAESLERQFKPNPKSNDDEFNQSVEQHGNSVSHENNETEENPIEVAKEEIEDIIKTLKNRKAPGIDGIQNQAIKSLPGEGHDEIVEIARSILKTGYYPNKWKTADTILIWKKGKDKKDPTNYRPISLLPVISKVIERLIHRRLTEFAEEKKIIPDHQFGFRKEHSTIHQLVRLTENIKEQANFSTDTGAIFLDIEKAFDKMWHQGLIYKMKLMKFPTTLTRLIKSYLEKRKFRVNIDGTRSTTREIEAGVPQGSVIGPLLFNLYMADIPKMNRCKIAQFADDTAIYFHNRIRKTISRHLQIDLDTLMEYFKKWRFKVNTTKTVAVYFGGTTAKKEKAGNVKIENQTLEWKSEAKYLGVILDERLNFNKQIEANRKKTRQLHGRLYPLLNARSKLSLENKLKIINIVLIPSITYAGVTWYNTRDNKYDTLQSTLNTVIRTAVGAPWYISNQQIREELKIKTIEEIVNNQIEKTIETLKAHENKELRKILQIKTRMTDKRKYLFQRAK